MGSQMVWDVRVAAPAAIVIKVHSGRLGWRWRIALRGDGHQPDQFGGGRGPVVLTYSFAVGKPYRSEAAAQSDAALILARDGDRWGDQ